jgi:hypothetical protein
VPRDGSAALPHLLAAAQIALAGARVAPGDAAEVQYTRVRDVRAIPGRPGTVTVHDERVLRVVRDAVPPVGWTREVE